MIDYVVATVNGQDVSLQEALALALWRGNLGFVEDAIDARTIRDTAEAMGIATSLEELQAAADAFRAARGLHKAGVMNDWLSANHFTVKQWQAYLALDILRDKLREALCGPKVNQYFAENQADFDRAVISRIVTKEKNVADELWYRIRDDGEDFGALARQYSSEAATAPAGGYVGPVARADLTPVLRAAAFAARAGEVIGPLVIKEGWVLLKVEEHLPALLDSETFEQIKARLFGEFLAEQRQKARILGRLPS